MDAKRFVAGIPYALFLLGLLLLLCSIVTWLRFHVQIPVRDTVRILPLIDSGLNGGWGSISLQEWLQPISGKTHRIVVTRLLMLVDYSLMGGLNYTIYLSAWLSVLMLVIVYLRAAGLQQSQDRAGRVFIVGISLIFLASPTQLLNLINPISASWFVAFACAAASVLIILSAGRDLSLSQMALACILAAIAAFSNFAGVVACLLLPVIALLQRSRLSVLVAVFSAATVFFYFYGIGPVNTLVADSSAAVATSAGASAISKLITQLSSPELLPAFFSKIANFVGIHLGAPLSARYPLAASLAVMGSVLLVVYQWVLLGLRRFSGQEPGYRSVEFSLVMATMCLVISCAIPLGRDVFISPLSDRYQTITMIYWLSISSLTYFIAQNFDGKRKYKQSLFLLACLPALAVFGSFNFSIPTVSAFGNHGSKAQILGQLGVNPYGNSDARWAKAIAPYFADHRELLAAYAFAPLKIQVVKSEEARVDQALCDGFQIHQEDSRWPGVQEVRLIPSGISSNPFLTKLMLQGSHGELGRMYARAKPKNDLRANYLDKRSWRGFYLGNVNESMPITVHFDPVIGRTSKCFLSHNDT